MLSADSTNRKNIMKVEASFWQLRVNLVLRFSIRIMLIKTMKKFRRQSRKFFDLAKFIGLCFREWTQNTYTKFEYVVSSDRARFKLLIYYVDIHFKGSYLKGRSSFTTEGLWVKL